MNKKTFSEKVKAKAVQMMLEGSIPQKQIAKKFGCSLASLQSWKGAAQNNGVAQEECEEEVAECAEEPCCGKHKIMPLQAQENGADDFVRKFWNKNYRAVDMLLAPKDVSAEEAVKLVNEALLYAYEQLRE